MSAIAFERYSVALLMLNPDAPTLAADALAALQDAHLSFLADLHASGDLLVVGPLPGPDDRRIRGLSIFRTGVDRTRELCEQDPAVRAGRFIVEVMPWMVPAGAVRFSRTRLPRSAADAGGG